MEKPRRLAYLSKISTSLVKSTFQRIVFSKFYYISLKNGALSFPTKIHFFFNLKVNYIQFTDLQLEVTCLNFATPCILTLLARQEIEKLFAGSPKRVQEDNFARNTQILENFVPQISVQFDFL